jgi:hypothetical protein
MKRALFLAAFVLTFGGVHSANAGIIVDQQQLSDSLYMAGFEQGDLAQSFKQSLNNITGAAVKLHPFGQAMSGDITISLYSNLPNAGGVLLASGTDLNVAGGDFAEVSFGGIIPITPNTTYYLVFTSSNVTKLFGIAGESANPYPNGQVYANTGFLPFPTYDYTFKTFADDTTTRPPVNTAHVPEPASIVLFGLLAGGGALYGWRRRQSI